MVAGDATGSEGYRRRVIDELDAAAGAGLDDRLGHLGRLLGDLDSVLVAFSGGADSAFLLAAAVRRLGIERVAAATGVSAALPAHERDGAAEFAAELGVRWYQPDTDELARDGYRANDGDRCYHCKSELLSVLAPLATSLGLATVVTGTNADDLVAGFRPGIRAAAAAGARTPLADAGLTKADVRAASHRWGLRTWDKPAAACLSSRIAFGLTITAGGLRRVERAEAAVRAALDEIGVGGGDVRVRDLGQAHSRIELGAVALDVVAGSDIARARVVAAVHEMGFTDVDVAPFRSGSMNDLLVEPSRFR